MTAALTPQPLLDGLLFPEGPRWRDGRLWFADMHARKVMTVDLNGHAETIVEVPQRPSGLGFLPDGRLLIVSMIDRRLLRLDPDGLHQVADLSGLATGDLNDMVVDEQGRAYVGNFGFDLFGGAEPRPASIALVTPNGDARVVAEPMMFPNGSVITPDGRTLIVAETFANILTAFHIASDGSLSGRRAFADLGERTPDGICLDAEGAVWFGAGWTGQFVRVREGGEMTHVIPVPGKMAVACMLGGEDGRTLFLLTAQGTMEEMVQRRSQGWIETVRVEVAGAGLP